MSERRFQKTGSAIWGTLPLDVVVVRWPVETQYDLRTLRSTHYRIADIWISFEQYVFVAKERFVSSITDADNKLTPRIEKDLDSSLSDCIKPLLKSLRRRQRKLYGKGIYQPDWRDTLQGFPDTASGVHSYQQHRLP